MAKKILVVDDEPDILKVVSYRIKSHGYDVITAANGEKALEKIIEEKPDLILLDLRLPGISGREVCEKIKNNEEYKHIPIVFLTAGESDGFEKECKGWGASSYIAKPFDANELKDIIDKYMK